MTGYKSKKEAALDEDGMYLVHHTKRKDDDDDDTQVYQRPWVGLTEEDFSAINQSCFTKLQAATSAESILKERNT